MPRVMAWYFQMLCQWLLSPASEATRQQVMILEKPINGYGIEKSTQLLRPQRYLLPSSRNAKVWQGYSVALWTQKWGASFIGTTSPASRHPPDHQLRLSHPPSNRGAMTLPVSKEIATRAPTDPKIADPEITTYYLLSNDQINECQPG